MFFSSGSEDEIADLKAAYLESEGDMDVIMDSVLCSNPDDEPRYTKLLKEMIKKGEVPDFKAFSKESAKKKSARQKRVG